MGIRRRTLLTMTAALVTMVFAVAVAASAATAAPTAPVGRTAAAHAGSASAGPTVITTEHTAFGTVLVTGTGESLYTFTGDEFPSARPGCS